MMIANAVSSAIVAFFPYLLGAALSGHFRRVGSARDWPIPLFLLGALPLTATFFLARSGLISISLARLLLVALGLAALGVWRFSDISHRSHWKSIAGFAGIFVLLTWVGAYHEIPSDPVAHLENIERAPLSSVAYFWIHLGINSFPSHSLFRLDLWQGFAAVLLALAIFRLALCVGENQQVAWLCVLASFAFLGTNLFSYYRYYVFAKSLFAFLIFVDTVPLLFSFAERPTIGKLFLIGTAFVLTGISHLQETFFLLIGISLFPFLYRGLTGSLVGKYRLKTLVVLVGFTLILVIGAYAALWFKGTPPWRVKIALNVVPLTLGVPGYLSVLAAGALLLFPQIRPGERKLSAFTLAFLLPVLFPPSYLVLARIFDQQYIVYRLCYGALYFMPLTFWFLRVTRWFFRSHLHQDMLAGCVCALLLIALGMMRRPPIYGRLDHLFWQVHPAFDLSGYAGALRFLEKFSDTLGSGQCRIHSDTNGMVALSVLTPWHFKGTRFHFPETHWPMRHPRIILIEFRDYKACYLMYRKPVGIGPSRIAQESGHWDPAFATPEFQVRQDYWRYFESRPYAFSNIYEDAYVRVYQFTFREEDLSEKWP